jgi:23S rRNA pseudouridine1911/1915/1917 synthase
MTKNRIPTPDAGTPAFPRAGWLLSSAMIGPIAVEPDFRVVDESPDWIVVDKAAPLLVHPTSSKPEPTLLGGLQALLAYELANGGRLSIINRLDRETSGLVLVAKHREAAREFGRAFAQRAARKEYLAVVHGWPERPAWRVEAPLRRLGEVAESAVWVRQCVDPGGRPAATRFRVVKRFRRGGRRFALVQCHPESGRMHQIRVHLEHTGHPLVGDKIYGGDGSAYLEFIEGGWSPGLERRLQLPRHGLHASGLSLSRGGRRLGWHSPLPADLRRFLVGAPSDVAKCRRGSLA